ncbi:MAG: GHKL domain-containing protein [Lachnospiraceae bacterium]|nr:GHKL domain-containing protein [Lachnospiraceae bacterium]
MTNILDIPKIYTAIAEWMACVTAILIYRHYVSKKPRDLMLLFGGLAFSYLLIRQFQHFCETLTGPLWLLAMVCAVSVMLLTLKLSLHLNWKAALYLTSRVFIWAELAASLEWQIWFFYTFYRDNVFNAVTAFLSAIVIYVLIYLVFYWIESHDLMPELTPQKLQASGRQIITSWLITFSLFALSNLSYFLHGTPFVGSTVTDIFYIRTLSDTIGVIASQLFHLQKRDLERKEEAMALRLTLRNQYVQFRSSQDNIDMINRKYHDLKHQLQILREDTSDQQRIKYIDEIEEDLRPYEAENKTGNPILDTLLTSKQNRCIKEGITMIVVADGVLLKHLKVMDLCTIFGNALDNSIEHVMKIPETDHRLIHVTVSQKNSFICILVENYYMGRPITNGEIPETTKDNTVYHGYGLKSIKYTVEQYGGYINTSVRDNWFRLEMILPEL